MKKLSIFCCLAFMYNILVAQTTDILRVKGRELQDFIAREGYRYPTFMKARVYFNNGDSAGGKLNYNYLLQTMQFMDEKGDTLVISGEKNINYISIGLDTFFYENGYYEWLACSANGKLAVKRSLKTAGAEKLGAFGIPSATNRIQSEDNVSEVHPEKLEINEEIVFTRTKSFYIRGPKGHFVEASRKNFAKLFPNKNIDDYVKENKLNLNKESDLVELLVYVNK